MGVTNVMLPTTVTKGSGAMTQDGIAGATIAAGQWVYLDAATQTYKLAQADTLAKSQVKGVALNGAAVNQPVKVQVSGLLNGCTGLEAGEVYVVSDDSAGAMMKHDDIGAADYTTVVGIPQSATVLLVGIMVGGVAHA